MPQATQPLHRFEVPAPRLMADAGFTRDGELLPARVDVLAFGAPGPFLQEEGVRYRPCSFCLLSSSDRTLKGCRFLPSGASLR